MVKNEQKTKQEKPSLHDKLYKYLRQERAYKFYSQLPELRRQFVEYIMDMQLCLIQPCLVPKGEKWAGLNPLNIRVKLQLLNNLY